MVSWASPPLVQVPPGWQAALFIDPNALCLPCMGQSELLPRGREASRSSLLPWAGKSEKPERR